MSRRDSLGIAAQEDWGAAETTMEYFPPVESVDVGHNSETMEIDETTGTRFPTRIEKGTRFGELGISLAARPTSFPRFLNGLIGEPTTTQPDTTGAPTVFEHLFDPAASDPIPLSILVTREDPDPEIVDRFWDALVNELTLSCEPNGYLMASASVVSRMVDEDVAAPSPTSDTTRRWAFHQATVHLTFLEEDGLPVTTPVEVEIPVSSWSVTYNNGIPTDVFVLGSRFLYEVEPDNASCEVSFSPRTDILEHHRRALETFPSASRLRMVAEGVEIEGGIPFTFEVDVHLLEHTDAPANVSAADRLNMIEVTARAAFDDANTKFVDFIVTNAIASYAQPGT